MKHKFSHTTVLLQETIKNLNIKKNGIYIDGTFGYGGHSKEILKKLGKYGKLYAFDQDPYAVHIAKKLTKDTRFKIIHKSFSKMLQYSYKKNIQGKVHGILLDLGVSSIQIDNPLRGFSFISDGPLDMRMNPTKGISASEWLNKTNEKFLYKILKKYGEERFAKKISYAIITYKKTKVITNTMELVNIIKKAIPNKKQNKHPARRSFQAIRIHINKELEELQTTLKDSLEILTPGGRLLVISFHSLEDRIVKNFMNKYGKIPVIPSGLAITEKQINSLYKLKLKVFKKILPNALEIKSNSRSRSSILRIAEIRK